MDNFKVIDVNALKHNYNYCKNKCKNVMAMVKADAYGHCDIAIVNALKDTCKYFGVANEKEALKVKRILTNNHIVLVVGKTKCYSLLIKNGIHITIDNMAELQAIARLANKYKICANVHIAINTGMNRIGIKSINHFKAMLKFINNQCYINLAGIFTHLYNADCKINDVKLQLNIFNRFIKFVKNKNILLHIGGSFAINHKLPKYINMIRCGLFLYGYGNKNLKPVMTIQCKIIKITKCKKRQKVGYGNTLLIKDSRIALVPIGYADGLPRMLSNKAFVLVNNVKCKILGNICMDMFMVDVSGVKVKVGDNVTVFNDANYFAKLSQTSPYEILTNFSNLRGVVKLEK